MSDQNPFDPTELIIKQSAEIAKQFVGEFSKEPMAALGGILTDKINHWRFKNRVKQLLDAKDFLQSKGITPEKIAPDIFIPLLEAGSNTSDEMLSKMFSSLLASHLDPTTHDKIHQSYSQILQQLSSLDVKILSDYYYCVLDKQGNYRSLGVQLANCTGTYNITESEALMSFQNIWRLGICDHGPDALHQMNREKQICFTDFGWSFIQACHKLEQSSLDRHSCV